MYDYWHITQNVIKINDEYNILYYLKDSDFFPSIEKCIIIYIDISPTTCPMGDHLVHFALLKHRQYLQRRIRDYLN